MSRTSRVFILTSTYGVMAGTLTGIASLAFYSQPKDHLRNVAMGASLGLYVGLAMGAYLVYFVPDGASKSKKDGGESKEDPENPLNLPESEDEQSSFQVLPPEPSFLPLIAYDPQTKTGTLGVQYRF